MSRVRVGAAGSNRLARYLLAMLTDTVRCFAGAPLFNTAQDALQIGGRDVIHWTLAQPRKDVLLEPPLDLFRMVRGPRRAIFAQPLGGDGFECVGLLATGFFLLSLD